MREKTQANLRNQGVAIAEVRGALQILAQTNLIGKENIQARIKHWEAKLTDIQNKLTEIEFSEPIITLPRVKLTEEEKEDSELMRDMTDDQFKQLAATRMDQMREWKAIPESKRPTWEEFKRGFKVKKSDI